mmetsp:Transcript_24436/g.49594  ORF Transcript_24436/g.49594 Transcript_24436/m.49594 type:complete len:270 (-) Transcript_24436:97-906(-)
MTTPSFANCTTPLWSCTLGEPESETAPASAAASAATSSTVPIGGCNDTNEATAAGAKKALAGWGGTDDLSGRQRCYGYVGTPLGLKHFAASHAMREYSGDKAEEDRAANRRASSMLGCSQLPEGWDAALARLCVAVGAQVGAEYRAVVDPSQLVAVQPNLHNGQRFLKPHLDEPLHDGFGVVIVTVAVRGTAHILLRGGGAIDDRRCFRLDPSEAYALSGVARNACLHGVLSDRGSEARCSLNLRFGLHSGDPAGPYPAVHVAFDAGAV